MAKSARVHSVCECQASLGAELDEQQRVLRGWARDRRRRTRLSAPAHSIGSEHPRFDVAWFCPYCVRNTLRSFDGSALAYRETEGDEAAAVAAG